MTNLLQCADDLLREVEAVLSSGNLPAQRTNYFEGARDYLTTLKRLVAENSDSRKMRSKEAVAEQHPAVEDR